MCPVHLWGPGWKPSVHKRWTFNVVNTRLCKPSVHPADIPMDFFCPGFLRTSMPLIPWWPNPEGNLLLLLTQPPCHLSPPSMELILHPCIRSSNIDQELQYHKSHDRLWRCDGDSYIVSTVRISWVHRKKAQENYNTHDKLLTKSTHSNL